MTDCPITPPPELVEQWAHLPADWNTVAHLIAQWGADAELEACCEWLRKELYALAADGICAARRPKPPSLKEQAKQALFRFDANAHTTADEMQDDFDLIRQALEQLND
jgi:hypothetical protein